MKIGEKRVSQKGRSYPAATDFFQSDDPDFIRLYGEKASTLKITLPYASADENFPTGLERWVTSKKDSSRQVLTCYTKDSGRDPIALRLTDFVREDDTVRGPERGQNRTPITCRADDCPFFKDKSCKPMGRLTFFLDGDNHAQPLQFSTKAWNTIENIAGLLSSAQRLGPLNTPGRVFEMHVAFETQGDKRFPVVTLKEVQVVITPDNIDTASALADANIALEQGTEARVVLAKLLDAIRPGWRDDQRYIDRIKEVGPETALQGIFQRYDA